MLIKQRPFVPVNSEGMEVFNYPVTDLPYTILYADIAKYSPALVPWSWHEENELIIVYSGELIVYLSNKRIRLSEGDGLFINTNVLHSMEIAKGFQCEVLTFIFKPTLFLGDKGSLLYEKYGVPILKSRSLDFYILSQEENWQKESLIYMKEVHEAYLNDECAHEMLICEMLQYIWRNIYIHHLSEINSNTSLDIKEQRLKEMLQFIHEHYMEPITLSQIAACINMSPREINRYFQISIGCSPMAYVVKHRITVGANLLINSSDSITDIAIKTGFNSVSHFGRTFKKFYLCTPKVYRAQKDSK